MDEHITTSTGPARVAGGKCLETQYYGFAVLWSIMSFWMVWQRIELAVSQPTYMVFNGAIAVFAFTVLLRPHWTILSAVLGGLHLAYAVVEMPYAQSHEMLVALFSATLIASYVTTAVLERRYDVGGVGLYRSFTPALRIMLVGTLLAKGISRLNWCFLDSSSSPLVGSLAEIRGAEVEPWILYFTMSMLVIVDVFLAVALLLPGLRRFAVGFGCCDMSWQAWMGILEARYLLPVLLVGFYCFLSLESIERIRTMLYRRVQSQALRRSGLPIGVVVVAMIAIAIGAQQKQAGTSPIGVGQFVSSAFAVFAACWVLQVLLNLVDRKPKLVWLSMMPKNIAHYLLLAVFAGFLLSPYLGIGNVGRFTGGSGLASTWNQNNHIFLPQASLTRFERDWVDVVGSSNDPYLAWVAEEGLRLTWYDFVNYVEPRPHISVDFRREGSLYEVARAGDIEELATPNPWWLRKLVSFEPLSAEGFRHSRVETVALNE